MSDSKFSQNLISNQPQTLVEDEFVRDGYSLRHSELNEIFEEWDPLLGTKQDTKSLNTREQTGKKNSNITNGLGIDSAPTELESYESENQETEDFKRGFIEGKAELERDFENKLKEVDALLETLKHGHCNISEFYSPLKKLVVKAIEGILKVEIKESRAAIEGIVVNMLDSVGSLSDLPIKVKLAQQDYESYAEGFLDRFPSVEFAVDTELSKGSTYAEMNDRTITDLSEDRIAEIIEQIFDEQ